MKKALIAGIISIMLIPDAFPSSFGSGFISALLGNDPLLQRYVLKEELELSNRLGIMYSGVNNKFLIGYDIDESIKKILNENTGAFQTESTRFPENFARVRFSVNERNYEKTFYFQNTYLVSPVYYHTRHWKRLESEYFHFIVSDTTLFNTYAMNRLDAGQGISGRKVPGEGE